MSYFQSVINNITSWIKANGQRFITGNMLRTILLELTQKTEEYVDMQFEKINLEFTNVTEDSGVYSFNHKAGRVRNNNIVTDVVAGAVIVDDDDTNYIEVTGAGVVSVNQVGFTEGQIPLYICVMSSGVATVTDKRTRLTIGAGHKIYSQSGVTPLTQRNNLRFKGYLKATDNDPDTDVEIDDTLLSQLEASLFIDDNGNIQIRIGNGQLLVGNASNFAVSEYVYTILGNHIDTDTLQILSNKLTPKLTTDKMWIGGLSNKPTEAEVFNFANIYKSTGNTANGQLSFTDIDGNSINTIPAGYVITDILIIETLAEASGDISIGTSALGTQVVNAETIGASAEVLAPLGTTFFFTISSQALYISSTDFGSGSVDVYISIRKLNF